MCDDTNNQNNENPNEDQRDNRRVMIIGASPSLVLFLAALSTHNFSVVVADSLHQRDEHDDDIVHLGGIGGMGIEDHIFYLRNHQLDNAPLINCADYLDLNKERSFNQSRAEYLKMPNQQRQYLNKWQPR